MERSTENSRSLLKIIKDVYERLPFNQYLGLQISCLEVGSAGFEFTMKKELVGNFVYGFLHGGVISAVLDATGGMTATTAAINRVKGMSLDQIADWISKTGTIDMRVDFLRPGRGHRFFSTGSVMRTGRKVSVTRMELKNETGKLIAVGTGAYIIG